MIRVAYIDHVAKPSGAQLAMVRLIEALEDVEAHVVLAEDGDLVGLLQEAGATVHVLPMDERARGLARGSVKAGALPGRAVLASTRYTARLTRLLRRLRPDLVHTNSLKAALYGGTAGRLARVPVVWHVRDRIADDYIPGTAVRVVRAASRVLPSAMIANSAATLATIRRPGVPSHVIPSLVRLEDFRGIPPRATAPGEPLVVGMLGRIAEWKGQHLFIDAFAEAFPGDSARGVIVGSAMFGEDEYDRAVRAQVARLGLEDRMTFAGFQPDVAGLLAGWDVLVHASIIPEPHGQVVVEGMAAGLPVVVAAAGGPMEYVTDEVDGLFYPPGDRAALVAALRRLAADPALRARLGEGGRRTAERFAPDIIAARVRAVYREVLSPRRR